MTDHPLDKGPHRRDRRVRSRFGHPHCRAGGAFSRAEENSRAAVACAALLPGMGGSPRGVAHHPTARPVMPGRPAHSFFPVPHPAGCERRGKPPESPKPRERVLGSARHQAGREPGRPHSSPPGTSRDAATGRPRNFADDGSGAGHPPEKEDVSCTPPPPPGFPCTDRCCRPPAPPIPETDSPSITRDQGGGPGYCERLAANRRPEPKRGRIAGIPVYQGSRCRNGSKARASGAPTGPAACLRW